MGQEIRALRRAGARPHVLDQTRLPGTSTWLERSGAGIVIEERDPEEVRRVGDCVITDPGLPVRNPAFDVTPAALVSALVTERGAASPVTAGAVARMLAAPVTA